MPRSAAAVATEDTQVLILDRPDFLRFLREHPDAAIAVCTELAARLRRSNDLLGDASFFDLPTRLTRHILQLSGGFGHEREDGVLIDLPFDPDRWGSS